MKKIGIMTLYSNNNFGAALQAFALQYVLNNYGYYCEDIKYIRDLNIEHPSSNNLLVRIKRVLFPFAHPLYIYCKKNKRAIFSTFIKNNIKESKKTYDKNDIHSSLDEYDFFICGSDNIWNKNLLDTSFILDFVPDNKRKIAYAPGMSATTLSDTQAQIMVPLIDRIDYLSCREKIGCDLIARLTGKKAFHAMDPTLLLSSDEWEKLIKNHKPIYSGEYIFSLIYGNSSEKTNYINLLGEKLNIKIISVPYATGIYNKFDTKLGNKHIYYAGPLEILNLIYNSKMVITDTFHATVFSILFHKNFISLRRFKNTKSEQLDYRIDGLLEKLEIEDNHIIESIGNNDFECVFPDNINYSIVEKNIIRWRKESLDFLFNAVDSCEKQ